VTPQEARARIAADRESHAFIAVSDEDGEGPVVAVKDLIDVKGIPTTGGGVILPDAPAGRDAYVIRRLREHGCVMIGKTNLHEWAFGVTSANPHYGTVRNPRAPGRVAGGSSGGSAAAVALRLCDWAIGSDTGGSIRIPAAYCGVVGFKPTIGTVDMEGVLPLSRTLDTLGPLAPDVRTAARALEMLSGLEDLVPSTPRPLERLNVAVPLRWGDDLDEDSMGSWRRLTDHLPRIPFPDRDRIGRAGLTILQVEAAEVHRRWVEMCPERYGGDVLGLLREGLGVARQAYVEALLEQSRMRVDASRALEGWDAVLVPATRVSPPRVGEAYRRVDLTCYTRPFNTTGQPVITLPAPVSGLPVGIQVVGHYGKERDLVEVALALESAWSQL
jgi:aspartyl-tRNA(Asn)/glutamyl-tRNA(Gln) amidotransferase subunit A